MKVKHWTALAVAALVVGGSAAGIGIARAHGGGPGTGTAPLKAFYVDITKVRPNKVQIQRRASPGSFVNKCGNNEEKHRNSDNHIAAPGVVNAAQHQHDHVGNLTTNGRSSDRSLLRGGTTCATGDKSSYLWPVLRDLTRNGDDAGQPGGGKDGNLGAILDGKVTLLFRGNRFQKVVAAPQGLRMTTGDAKPGENGPGNVRVSWTCRGFEDRTTAKYPVCPRGRSVVRLLEYPSCWDGRSLDSANHRDHVRFPDSSGRCPRNTVAIPQLDMTVEYAVPAKANVAQGFALDGFPQENHRPDSDHGFVHLLMNRTQMGDVVRCVNSGRTC
ncbi:DUF1996 domain-containing protein [Actinokineospora xionganensis]|uniref:DUF1996 domain-containing protein n=1 Tax=Actinokineospora xionganensis TaxID=2684470 RepID=A0ABR7LA00_9PSEU|nr:DUF1996 domain-containing protein [Actinokineospora xionganensis]MBC6449545.1 DUF1996 domain-containing protein [Actinokineospora xionganensis]